MPTGTTSRIASIETADGEVAEAFPPMAVVITLEDDIAVSRGDILCRPNNRPSVAHDLEATVCWMDERSALAEGRSYLLKHSTRTVRATAESLQYRLDVNGLHRDEAATELALNEIGRVSFHCTEPLLVDDYTTNRTTGSFIIIDPLTNATVGAGVIRVIAADARQPQRRAPRRAPDPGRPLGGARVQRARRSCSQACRGPASRRWPPGVEEAFVGGGRPAFLLDGDNLRHGLNADLGFSDRDRTENVRRAGEVARMFAEAGSLALIALICPFEEDRQLIRALHEEADLPYAEIFVNTTLEECERRDPKGLYARARAGQLPGFTGIDSAYEVPARRRPGARAGLGFARRADRPRRGTARDARPVAVAEDKDDTGPRKPARAARWRRARPGGDPHGQGNPGPPGAWSLGQAGPGEVQEATAARLRARTCRTGGPSPARRRPHRRRRPRSRCGPRQKPGGAPPQKAAQRDTQSGGPAMPGDGPRPRPGTKAARTSAVRARAGGTPAPSGQPGAGPRPARTASQQGQRPGQQGRRPGQPRSDGLRNRVSGQGSRVSGPPNRGRPRHEPSGCQASTGPGLEGSWDRRDPDPRRPDHQGPRGARPTARYDRRRPRRSEPVSLARIHSSASSARVGSSGGPWPCSPSWSIGLAVGQSASPRVRRRPPPAPAVWPPPRWRHPRSPGGP